MFEYEVVPVMVTRGAGRSAAGEEWAAVRDGLNQCGRAGFRVVAVSDGAEGRAIIMERSLETADQTVTEAAEEITRTSAPTPRG